MSAHAQAEVSGEESSENPTALGVWRCECGRCFITKRAYSIHENSCGNPTRSNTPTVSNPEYRQFLCWLEQATADGSVRFKSKAIAEETGPSPSQIGVFMTAVESSDEYDVGRLAYTSATMWEVNPVAEAATGGTQ